MLHSIISDLQNACDLGNAIELRGDLPWLSKFKSLPRYTDALERLDADRHAVDATGAMFADQKIVPIASDDSGWNAFLISLRSEATALSTAAGAAIVHIVEAQGPLVFEVRPLEGLSSLFDLPGQPALGEASFISLGRGATFVVPHGMTAIQLRGTSSGVKLLRFNGPVREPITLSFDASGGNLLAASFSDAEATGRHFFAILLSQLARSNSKSHHIFNSEETETTAALVEQLMKSEIHAFTRWKLVQTLAQLRPAAAMNALRRMAAEEELPNLRLHAAQELEKQVGVFAV